MNTKLTASATFALALALAACGQQNGAGGNTAASTAPANSAAADAGTGNAAEASSETGSAASGDTTQQDFTIVNNTGHTVMTLNVSPTTDQNWGPDILGRDVLANGESAEIEFARADDQCEWDIRVTYDDNDSSVMEGVNLCETTTVTLTP